MAVGGKRLDSIFSQGPELAAMNVKMSVLADFASITREGKLNILGIFDEINPNSLPTALPIFYIVVVYDAGPAEVGSSKRTALVLHDADGVVKARLEQSLTVQPPARAGRRTTMNQVHGVVQFPFDSEGDYQFAILINEQEEGTISLRVNPPTEEAHATGN